MPKFDYAVNYNGRYYPADVEIPEAEAVEAVSSASTATKPGTATKPPRSRKKGDD